MLEVLGEALVFRGGKGSRLCVGQCFVLARMGCPERLWCHLLGDLQGPPGCGAGHPAWGGTAGEGVGPVGPEGPPASAVL